MKSGTRERLRVRVVARRAEGLVQELLQHAEEGVLRMVSFSHVRAEDCELLYLFEHEKQDLQVSLKYTKNYLKRSAMHYGRSHVLERVRWVQRASAAHLVKARVEGHEGPRALQAVPGVPAALPAQHGYAHFVFFNGSGVCEFSEYFTHCVDNKGTLRAKSSYTQTHSIGTFERQNDRPSGC